MAAEYEKVTDDLTSLVQEVYRDVKEFKEKHKNVNIVFDVDEVSKCNFDIFYLLNKKPAFVGKCAKTSKVQELETGKDYSIIIVKDYWDGMTLTEKKGLLFHELLHIVKAGDKWKIRAHNINPEFSDVGNVYGIYDNNLKNMKDICDFRDSLIS